MGALLFGAQSMTAQDTSSWKTGDDVTDQLQWQGMDGKTAGVWKGNKSFEGQSGRYFVNGPDYCGEGGNQNSDGAGFYGNDFEMWNASAGAEAYQIFYLPAGVYTFKIQATSRESRNASDFFDETAPYNSEFYAVSQKLVSEATTDADGNAVEAVYENNGTEVTAKIMNIFAAQQTSQVYTWPADASSWQSDGTNVYEGTTYYMPSSMWGTGAWFDQDLYWPEEDSEFNTIKVLQMEDGYMRIGVRKRANINDDWVIWRGCKAIYPE